MGDFFYKLSLYDNISNWVKIIDWIFGDKFSGVYWNSGYVAQFMKKIKKLDGVSGENFEYLSACRIVFPKHRSNKSILIQIGSGTGESRDLLRHIRNAIAHNNASVFQRRSVYYFEFKDFSSDGKRQTAYIIFPIDYLEKIYEIYRSVENSAKRNG